jgi:hypothetical protein
MRSVPPREWLAVLLPPLFGVVLLAAGASAAAAADAWWVFALSASVGAVLPLAYTLQLVHERRLFLRSRAAIRRSRSRVGPLVVVGWLVGATAVGLLAAVDGSGRTALYAGLGAASLGIWPGLLANFIRLWREEWAPAQSARNVRH